MGIKVGGDFINAGGNVEVEKGSDFEIGGNLINKGKIKTDFIIDGLNNIQEGEVELTNLDVSE